MPAKTNAERQKKHRETRRTQMTDILDLSIENWQTLRDLRELLEKSMSSNKSYTDILQSYGLKPVTKKGMNK